MLIFRPEIRNLAHLSCVYIENRVLGNCGAQLDICSAGCNLPLKMSESTEIECNAETTLSPLYMLVEDKLMLSGLKDATNCHHSGR